MLHTMKPTYLMTVYCLHGAAPIGLFTKYFRSFTLTKYSFKYLSISCFTTNVLTIDPLIPLSYLKLP